MSNSQKGHSTIVAEETQWMVQKFGGELSTLNVPQIQQKMPFCTMADTYLFPNRIAGKYWPKKLGLMATHAKHENRQENACQSQTQVTHSPPYLCIMYSCFPAITPAIYNIFANFPSSFQFQFPNHNIFYLHIKITHRNMHTQITTFIPDGTNCSNYLADGLWSGVCVFGTINSFLPLFFPELTIQTKTHSSKPKCLSDGQFGLRK